MSADWNKGLFSCLENIPEFLYAWCFPNCANASARTAYDNSDWVFNCLCLTPCAVRNIVREGYSIQGTCAEDILWTWLCHPCVITQVKAEIAKRGPITKMISTSPSDWQQPMFGCMEYPVPFMYALCLPSCAAGSVYTKFDPNQNCVFTTLCIGPFVVRNVVRESYGIQGTCCSDILWMYICGPCAITQMHGEVEKRGPHKTAAPGAQGMK